MQLKFQTIPKHNAQLFDTYIGDIILNSRICTGACLRVAAGYWGELGLGRVLTPLLLLGLLQRLRWFRNHLVHDLIGCGFYMYAIAMRNA